MKATIYLTVEEYDSIFVDYVLNSNVEHENELTPYGIVLHFDADNLGKFLYYLPHDHYLRTRFQRAGDNIFWRRK